MPRRATSGFTMLEMAVVLVIAGILLSIASGSFSMWKDQASARRAAQVFSRDLTMARSIAVRSQEKVTIRFYESTRYYLVRTASGRELVRRQFTTDSDVPLSSVDLLLTGDSVAFSTRGVGDLAGATVGSARFRAGTTTYQVQFNSTGSAKVAEL